MEAVREYQGSPPIEALQSLPPPPSAFPVEQLQELQSQEESVQNSDSGLLDVSSIQKACLSALSSLLQSTEHCQPSSSSSPPEEPVWTSEENEQLAGSLKELLEVCHELESLSAKSVNRAAAGNGEVQGYQQLVDQLSQLEASMGSTFSTELSLNGSKAPNTASSLHPAVAEVRQSLNHSRLETLCSIVSRLCHERLQRSQRTDSAHADDPPVYRHSVESPTNGHRRQSSEALPDYTDAKGSGRNGHDSGASKQGKPASGEDQPIAAPLFSEKMLTELDAVTSAIDRLFDVAPQLADQRATLRPSWLSQATGDSRSVMQSPYSLEEERAKEKELMEIWDRIERAHGGAASGRVAVQAELRQRSAQDRKESFMNDLLDRSEAGRMRSQDSELIDVEFAKARELKRRDHFLRDLLAHTANGRMASQDMEPPRKRSVGELAEIQDRRRSTLLENIVEASSAGRLSAQEHPYPAEQVKTNRRDHFMSTLASYGSKGRLDSQDCEPSSPLPTTHHVDGDAEEVLALSRATSVADRADSKSVASVLALSRSASGSSRKTRSSLEKVASFVRRASVSKAPAVAEPDLQSLSYVAEHQENLQVVQILLSTPIEADWSSYTAETEVSSVAGPIGEPLVVLRSSSGGPLIRLDLPAPVTPWQKIHLKDLPSPTEFKLSAGRRTANPTSSLNMVIKHALSAPELRTMQPTALACTACDREVADLSTVSSTGQWERGAGFKDLPSEHWAEMLEAWMCHADAGFTNQLTQRTKDGFWPTPGTVLVGGSYFLVDEADTLPHNLRTGSLPNHDMWLPVACLCGEVVGRQKTRGNAGGNTTIRFAKHSVAVLQHADNGEETQATRFPLSVFIVSDMLELAQAHASYRFSVGREDDEDHRILIWLFNPSIGISYRCALAPNADVNHSPVSTPSRSSFIFSGRSAQKSQRSSMASSSASVPLPAAVRSIRAVKVLYRIVSSADLDKATTTSDTIMAGFKTGHSTEHLSYPKAVCDELEDTLRHSTSVYPASRRQMGTFSVGFLERI